MKKIVLIFVILNSLLNASDSSINLKMQILESIYGCIKSKESMKIWSDDKQIMDYFKSTHKFEVVSQYKDANFIILEKIQDFIKDNSKKHIFVLNYCLLEKIPSSFGAFFWKKGRPNIVFIKPRLQKQNLHLSHKLSRYVEEQVW